MKKAKLVLLRSELGAGTRGASMGVDALKTAAIDLKSDYFRRFEHVEIIDENWLLLENVKFKYAKLRWHREHDNGTAARLLPTPEI